MTLSVRVGGAWKTVDKVWIRKSGVWKEVERMLLWRSHDGTTGWREFFLKGGATPPPPPPPDPTPPPPPPVTLTVTFTYPEVYGNAAPGIVTTDPAIGSASGGTGPYTYQWTIVDWDTPGVPTIVAPTNPISSFSANMPYYEMYQNARFKLTAIDSLGNTGSKVIPAIFSTQSEYGGGGPIP